MRKIKFPFKGASFCDVDALTIENEWEVIGKHSHCVAPVDGNKGGNMLS